MEQHQLMWYILIATGLQIVFVVLIIILFVKLYKYKRLYKEELEISNRYAETNNTITRQNGTLDNRVEDLTLRLERQLPQTPFKKHIKYYNSTKEIDVHIISERLGIAIISDVDQLNYSVRLVDELLEDSDLADELLDR